MTTTKFNDLYAQYSQSIFLEELPPADVAPEQPVAPKEPVKSDVPASISTLGNLLKKALTMTLSEEDQFMISRLPEIDETNANVQIPKILEIMRLYSNDVDISKNSV